MNSKTVSQTTGVIYHRLQLVSLHPNTSTSVHALTLSLLMSYIHGAPCKTRNFNVVYIDISLRLATLKVVSFYLLHNF
jgi:hypothetical protein